MENVNSITIARYLSYMNASDLFNGYLLKEIFPDLNYRNQNNQSILHILVDHKYNERQCVLAIKALFYYGVSPNLQDDAGCNFIQTALNTGYSESFILNIITASLEYDLDVNHVDNYGDTIMYTAIYSDNYQGGIEMIYDLLCSNGYDSTKIGRNGKDLLSAFEEALLKRYFCRIQYESFKKKYEERYSKLYKDNQPKEIKTTADRTAALNSIDGYWGPITVKEKEVPVATIPSTLSDEDILELEKYGKILNRKNYIAAPTIGREKELKNLMIALAQDKKRPLIVGESGVGKTAIIDELAYRIKMGQVPSFLQGKIILDVDPSDVVAGCKYVGMFEDNMTKLMKLCERLDVIVFIDEIHTIYGIGSAEYKDNDMSSMLKRYIDRSSLKVIGTTTEKEYQEYFSGDALKRRFEKIIVKEPTEDVLYQIVDKVIGDYYIKSGISFENENIRTQIVNIILNATGKNHRVYNDRVNNPDLAISIVDKAFAFAKVCDGEFITAEHFIESFECCDRIYESAREQAKARLRNLDASISKPVQRILKTDFSK